jgi:3-phenylpropionate/trans-cinnamate dioxygenase ferredoxin subunit
MDKMNVPTPNDGFVPTISLDELQLNRPKRVKTEHGFVVLAKSEVNGVQIVSAFTPLCPHAMGDLSYGSMYQGEIECPVHGYRFDIQSGMCTMPGDESPLRVYASVIVNNVVHVKLEKPKWLQD